MCQGFYSSFKLSAYIGMISERSGDRGGVYIKFIRNVFMVIQLKQRIMIKYKEFTTSNRLRNRLQMFYLNSEK